MKQETTPGQGLTERTKAVSFTQKMGCVGVAVLLMLTALAACSSGNSANESAQPAVTQAYGNQYAEGNKAEAGNDAVKDWMKDQAQGKAYGYDDGGSYYCMGKNDTCKNKTNNKYDLYCNSCDPDGDNVEG